MFQQLNDGAAHALCSPIVSSRTTHPVKQLKIWIFFGSWHFKAFSPVRALGWRQAPGVAVGWNPAKSGCAVAGEGPLGNSISPHIRDQRQWIDAHRADAHAGRARGAGPEGLGLDRVAVEGR